MRLIQVRVSFSIEGVSKRNEPGRFYLLLSEEQGCLTWPKRTAIDRSNVQSAEEGSDEDMIEDVSRVTSDGTVEKQHWTDGQIDRQVGWTEAN